MQCKKERIHNNVLSKETKNNYHKKGNKSLAATWLLSGPY